MSRPTLTGYTAFIRSIMAVGTDVLPDNSPYIPGSYQAALQWVSRNLRALQNFGCFGGPPDGTDPAFPSLYARAVYNLAGDRLVNYAQDVSNTPVEGSELPYFANLRETMKINSFTAGAVSGTSDEGTSVSIAVPEAIANGMTFSNLQNMKTPWGREYLGIIQSLGPSVWGLS